jgi:circadian clock protein KaiC
MLMRLIDFLKMRQITAFFTALTQGGSNLEKTDVRISSLIDTWLLVRDTEVNGERNRCIYVLKSRGMAHSNQVREFVMTSKGINLIPVYVGGGTVLTGSARLSQEAREKAEELSKLREFQERRRDLEAKRKALEARVNALRAEFAEEEKRAAQDAQREKQREKMLTRDITEMTNLRDGKRANDGKGA